MSSFIKASQRINAENIYRIRRGWKSNSQWIQVNTLASKHEKYKLTTILAHIYLYRIFVVDVALNIVIYVPFVVSMVYFAKFQQRPGIGLVYVCAFINVMCSQIANL